MVSYFVSFVINCSEQPSQLSFGSIEVFLEQEITSMEHVNQTRELIRDRINSEFNSRGLVLTDKQIVILNWNKLDGKAPSLLPDVELDYDSWNARLKELDKQDEV